MHKSGRLWYFWRWLALVASVWTAAAALARGAEYAPGETADQVRLGAVLPLTGAAESYGRAGVQGAQLAVDEINARGGVLGRRLTLILLDDQSKPLRAKQAAQEAVLQSVSAVIGPMWSSHSLAAAAVLQAAGIPMITPGATAPTVTRVGNFIFRTCYTDDFQGALMADFAFHDLGYRRAGVLINISETYSRTLADYFIKAFNRMGGTVVYRGAYKGTAVEFSDVLSGLLPFDPQVVFIPGYSRDAGLLIRQARAMNIKVVFIGADAWEPDVYKYAGDSLEGSFFSTHWHAGVPFIRSRRFIELFRQRYGNDVSISPFAPLTYDAVLLFADAIERAGTLDRGKIRDALAATHNFDGATGVLTFDANGDPLKKSAGILKFENGAWRFYKAYEPH